MRTITACWCMIPRAVSRLGSIASRSTTVMRRRSFSRATGCMRLFPLRVSVSIQHCRCGLDLMMSTRSGSAMTSTVWRQPKPEISLSAITAGMGAFTKLRKKGAPPLISIFCADGERKDISCFYDEDTEEPSEDYVIDVTLDRQERIWAMLDDEETAVMYDKDGSLTVYSLPISGVSALAVPDDYSCLYASSQDEEEADCYWLFRIPLTEDDEEDEEPEICAVQTPEGNAVFTDGSSFLKNIMAALIDGVIYVINL